MEDMFERILSIILTPEKIDICEINKGLKYIEIIHSMSQPIPAEIRDKGAKKIGEFLKQICIKNHIMPDVVHSALPCSSSMFRHIQLPFHDMNKLAKVYSFEVEQTLPYSLDEVVMDYQILKTDRASGTDILVAVIPKKLLEEHLNILNAAGIDPDLTTLDTAGLHFFNNAFLSSHPKDIQGIIDINQKMATLLISDKKKILLNRQIDRESAGDDMDHLADQIALTLTSFLSDEAIDIKKVLITGHSKEVETLQNIIKHKLGIFVEPVISYANIPIKIKGNHSRTLTPLAAAFGLCLTGRLKKEGPWNFRQGNYAYQKTYLLPRQMFLFIAALLVLVLVLAGLNLRSKSEFYSNRIHLFDSEIKKALNQTLPETAWDPQILSMLKDKIAHEEDVQSKYHDFTGVNVNTLDILRELSIRIPVEYNVIIQEILLQNSILRIKGKTATFEILDKLKTSLDKSKTFQAIKIEQAKGKGNQVSFEIIMELKKT